MYVGAPFALMIVVSTNERARCADGRGSLTPMFFSDEPLDMARAKAICSRCGLAAACLAAATERREPWGTWGGQFFVDGQAVAVKRRRGRPPRHPRPAIVVDECPSMPLPVSA